MLRSFLGTKVGMTQLFGDDRKVVPATVVKVGTWFVTQVKTKEKDGYEAIQVGTPRKRYVNEPFSEAWLSKKACYFLHLKELPAGGAEFKIGDKISFENIQLADGDPIDVSALSKGLGFQGVMKRWGFSGGPGAHGSNFHRAPGSVGNLVFRGEVFKGKKLPGRMGGRRVSVKNLKVVRVDVESGHVFVSGSIPGKKDSFVVIRSKKVV